MADAAEPPDWFVDWVRLGACAVLGRLATEFTATPARSSPGEFFPDADDKAAIAVGMEQLRAEQRAWRLAEMRRRLGITRPK
jgi:hypothetical protein